MRRKKAIGYIFLYIFTLISGITTYPIIAHYLSAAGANVVILAGVTTNSLYLEDSRFILQPPKGTFSFLGEIIELRGITSFSRH